MQYCLLTFVVFLISLFEVVVARELKFVQAIWRHGSRAPPKKPYSNDPHDEDEWPRGWDQLTELGMKQMLELGRFFKQRYSGNFTRSEFNPDEIYIRSSAAERCVDSAKDMLHGFFPFDTQNFTIHTAPSENDDPLLKPVNYWCPAYEELYNKNAEDWLHSIQKNYASLFKFIGEMYGYGKGLNFEHIIKLKHIEKEILHNMTQPSWVLKSWPEYGNKSTIELIDDMEQVSRAKEFNTRETYPLKAGLLLGDLLKRAQKVVNGTQKEPSKMVLYSSHGGTLYALTYALQISDQENITDSACIIMEIWKNDNNEHEIELLHHNNGQISKVSIPGCGQICPFKKLYDLKKDDAIFDVKELDRKCGRTNGYLDREKFKSWKSVNLIV